MSYFVFYCAVVDQLPRLGKREQICLLSFTRNYVVSVRRFARSGGSLSPPPPPPPPPVAC